MIVFFTGGGHPDDVLVELELGVPDVELKRATASVITVSLTSSVLLMNFSLNLGSRKDAISKRWETLDSWFFRERSLMILERSSLVNGLSFAFSFRTDVSRRSTIGKTAEIVSYFSQDITSVKSASGESASLIAFRTSKSCQVGRRCEAFLSALRTILIAFSCSRTLSTIFCIEPHLVLQSYNEIYNNSVSMHDDDTYRD